MNAEIWALCCFEMVTVAAAKGMPRVSVMSSQLLRINNQSLSSNILFY
jgi:hypothetical protein